MVALEPETKTNIESLLGEKLSILDNLTISDEIERLSKDSSHNIKFLPNKDTRKIGCGNPLIDRGRFKTMEDVNKGLDKIR